jgi:hypothetical protein
MNRLFWEEIVMIHLTRCLPQNSEDNQFASSDNQELGINTVRGCGHNFNQVLE